MRSIILIAHNLRSTHNVGSLLRTAEGLGIERVYLTGYTPYPAHGEDTRLPHLSAKITKDIHKTALGAELTQVWTHRQDIHAVLHQLKFDGYNLVAVEQTSTSIALPDFKPSAKIALIIGREVEGIEADVINACDDAAEIPMFGRKESFNVVQAAAMALYHCRFYP